MPRSTTWTTAADGPWARVTPALARRLPGSTTLTDSTSQRCAFRSGSRATQRENMFPGGQAVRPRFGNRAHVMYRTALEMAFRAVAVRAGTACPRFCCRFIQVANTLPCISSMPAPTVQPGASNTYLGAAPPRARCRCRRAWHVECALERVLCGQDLAQRCQCLHVTAR